MTQPNPAAAITPLRHRGAGRAAALRPAGRPAHRRARGRQPALHPLRRPRAAARRLLHRAQPNWGTYNPEISNLTIVRDRRRLSRHLRRGHRAMPSRSSATRAEIEGAASGSLTFPRQGPRGHRFRDQPHRLRRAAPGRGRGRPAGARRACRRPHGRHGVPGPDRPGAADDGPARHHPRGRRRACASPAAWRATPSRWRTSATGPTPPTRPMSARSRCPGPTRSPPARSSSRR